MGKDTVTDQHTINVERSICSNASSKQSAPKRCHSDRDCQQAQTMELVWNDHHWRHFRTWSENQRRIIVKILQRSACKRGQWLRQAFYLIYKEITHKEFWVFWNLSYNTSIYRNWPHILHFQSRICVSRFQHTISVCFNENKTHSLNFR